MGTPVNVLYVAGFGRSGSTLLGNVLGAYDRVFSTGELHLLWKALVLGSGCGCGTKVARCEVWAPILQDLRASGVWDGDPETVRRWQLAEARVVHTPRILRTPPTGITGRPHLDRYRALLSELYASIARVTGARTIIDTSKTPADAAVLPGVDGIEAWLLHLVRDPRAVAYSQGREAPTLDVHLNGKMMHRRGIVESSVRWVTANLLTERAARRYRSGRSLMLAYERFVAAPRATAERLLHLVGEPSDSSPFTAVDVVEFGPNHNVWGNRSRFVTGPVTIRRDDAWTSELADRRRRFVTTLCLPWMGRYGYRALPQPALSRALDRS
jgi:hypothetical protein